MDEQGVRINKYLSEAGVCSRREADRQIEAGAVTVDGVCARPGTRVLPGQTVCFQGRSVSQEEERILLAFHKPAGIVCTAEKREKNNVIDYIHYPKRIYPVGRLDKDSEGLLLDESGRSCEQDYAGGKHAREGISGDGEQTAHGVFLRGMAGGVPLVELNATTRRCFVERIGKREFRIILTQGLNRQIRRMCEYFGYRVEKLVRVRIMNIELGSLKSGTYRNVTEEEYHELLRLTADSSSDPVMPAKKTGEKKR